MEDGDTARSPLEAAAGAAGPHAVDGFKLLSDETRLAILLALWEAYDPRSGDGDTLTFTELLERVGAPDSGNFSYHLDKLVGRFVAETDHGYELRGAGHKVVQGIIAGSGLGEATLQPTEIPRTCHRCGSTVEISYQDQRLYQRCTECEGNLGPGPVEEGPPRCPKAEPRGTLMAWDLAPAGLAHRDPEEVFVAGTIRFHRDIGTMIRGICPECSGPVEGSLHICDSHEAGPETVCPTCGSRDEIRAGYVCKVCKHAGSFPVQAAVHDHPAVVSFYHDHGFEMTHDLDGPVGCGRLWDRLQKEQDLVSRHPVRVRVSIPYDGETLHLILDEDLDVIEVTRQAQEPEPTRATAPS